MARNRKRLIFGSIGIALGLSVVLSVYKAWSMTAIRCRPWLLEYDLRSRLSECRTGSGLIFLSAEWGNLTALAQEAESCLAETDGKVWFQRNYSPCVSKIFAAELDAGLLILKLEQRKQDQKKILEDLILSLSLALSGNKENEKIWTRFNLIGIEEARTESLLQEAKKLYAQGKIESAFHTALKAKVSWDLFSQKNDSRFARFSDASLREKWNRQVDNLLQWSKRIGRRAIVVDKLEHACLLIDRGRAQKRYRADLGRKWYQRKTQAQDSSTPEGDYVIARMIPSGKYGHALLINYPNAEDTTRFQLLKRNGTLPANARIGGNIEIHGTGKKESDWTDGCVALDDDDMRELYRFAYIGMPVSIVGTSRWTSSTKDQ
jgi:hypothetical protein